MIIFCYMLLLLHAALSAAEPQISGSRHFAWNGSNVGRLCIQYIASPACALGVLLLRIPKEGVMGRCVANRMNSYRAVVVVLTLATVDCMRKPQKHHG